MPLAAFAPISRDGAAPDEQPPPDAKPNRRASPRRPASAVPAITALRLSPYGVEAKLLDISASGLLARCGVRLKPGGAVTVVFEGTFSPSTATGRIVRCSVEAMAKDGTLQYHVGIAFAKSLPLEALPEEAVAPPQAAAPAATPAAVVAPPVATPPAVAPQATASPAAASPAVAPPAVAPPVVRNRW